MRWHAVPALLVVGVVACSTKPPAAEGEVTPPVPATAQPEIPFPPDLFRRGINGEVMLYIVVDSSGAVIRDSTRIAASSGHAEFDAAAMAAAPTLQFTPATRNGRPVQHAIQVPIRFTIPDSTRAGDSLP